MHSKKSLTRRLDAGELSSHLPQLEERLGYIFNDKNLLQCALTHSSYVNEAPLHAHRSNERFEFLGDAILSQIVSFELFLLDRGEEGHLSQLRASLVDTKQCALYCQALDLQHFLLFGRGLINASNSTFTHLCANLFEALLAAIFLDSDFATVRNFFLMHFKKTIEDRLQKPVINWKAQLQAYCQKHFGQTPKYQILEETGPQHARLFTVSACVGEQTLSSASASSKQEAQVQAAKKAMLEHLNVSEETIQNMHFSKESTE